MTKYKRWVRKKGIEEKELRNVVITMGLRIKSLILPKNSQWYHLYLEGSKKSMQDFDSYLRAQKIQFRNRKPKGAKDIGAFSKQIGTNFEYQVKNDLNDRDYITQRRAASGSVEKQKGDVVLYDDSGKEIMTLETTKTRGKGIWISKERLERLLNDESEAIIFELGNSTVKFAIIPYESDSYPDMTFVDYLEHYINSHLEPRKETEEGE